MDKAIEGADAVHRVKRGRPAKVIEVIDELSKQQIYALRVWNGQSADVPRSERIERVMNALRGQNLPTDGITLPT